MKKIILLAFAAMFALPAVASAGEWSLDPAGGKFPVAFTLTSSGNTILTTDDGSGLKLPCSGITGSGIQVTATTSEKVTLTFSGCKDPLFGSTCTSGGEPTGSILTTELVGHNVVLEKGPPEVRGILLTTREGHFYTATCAGFFSMELGGSGVIGEMTAPTTCGAVSKTATVEYKALAEGTQKWTQVTTSGGKVDLTSSKNGATPVTAAQEGTEAITFAESMGFTC